MLQRNTALCPQTVRVCVLSVIITINSDYLSKNYWSVFGLETRVNVCDMGNGAECWS